MKATIALILALSFIAVFAKINKPKADSEDVWIWNGTTVTSASKPINPLATNNTEKDFYNTLTCTVALQKANKALGEFTATIKEAKDDWTAYAASEKLNRFRYYLDKGCEDIDLKIVNQGTVGLNTTEDEACTNFTKIIEPLVKDEDDDEDGEELRILSSEFLENLGVCKKALKLKSKLGAECKLAVVEDIQAEKSKIEELNLPPLVFLSAKKGGHGSSHAGKGEEDEEKEEKSEKKNVEDDEDEEEDENEEEVEKHAKKKVVKEEEEEPTKSKDEDLIVEEASPDGFVLRVNDVEADHVDSYTISYHKEPNGDKSVVIAHVSIKEYADENEDTYLAAL